MPSLFVASVAVAVLTVACGQESASYSPTAPTGLSDSAVLAAFDPEAGPSTTASMSSDSAMLQKGGNDNNKDKDGEHSNDAKGDNEHGHQGMLSGFVTAVGSDSIVIRGITVKVTSDTLIRHGHRHLAIGDIHVGDHAQARGKMDGSTLVASEIKVENTGNDEGEDEDDEDGNEVAGKVSDLSGTCATGLTFMVGTTKVTTNSSTKFEDGTCAAIRNLTRVDVEGTKGSNNTITATKVELDLDEIEGTISSFSGTGGCPSVTFNIGTTFMKGPVAVKAHVA